MKNKHWLLSAIEELEDFGKQNNLTGFVEGLAGVLEIYAAEATTNEKDCTEVISRIPK
ncbi:MAG: hypothetical protein AB8B95_12955 [Pseudohongiellaceae bacterium]